MTRVVISALGQRGEGIAEIDGRRIFVPFTLPGDLVDIDVDGARGILRGHAVDPQRAPPPCRHFTRCGGCQLQHLPPETYARFKRSLVETALSFAGIDAEVEPLVDARGEGRRRATLHATRMGAGYMVQRTHELYAIDTCPILVPALARGPLIAQAAAEMVGPCDVSLTATLSGLDVAVRTGKRVAAERLVAISGRFALARLSLNGEMVIQNAVPLVAMGRAEVELPVGGFLQATAAAEDVLSGLVMEALAGCRSVADLFCGVGPFALRLAERMKVTAMDSDRPAIAALQKAVRNTQGLKPVSASARDLFREPLGATELTGFDGLVFDPPRAGADAQVRELARSRIGTIVGVSCDPKTFARDARILLDGGYRLERATPVDQFAFSTHVEIVGVFRR